jgi:ABC-type glycerol-3-phosphate transport system substrate-binding protein
MARKLFANIVTVMLLGFIMALASSKVALGAQAEAVLAGNYSWTDGDISEVGNGLKWSGSGGEVKCKFEVPEDGLYNLGVRYYAFASKSDSIELSIALESSGQNWIYPSVSLKRPLKYGPIEKNSTGDETRPKTSVDDSLNYCLARLSTGLENSPLLFELRKGAAVLTLSGARCDFILESLSLSPPALLSGGSNDPLESEGFQPAKVEIKIQAENISRASESVLSAQYDKGDALVEPSDPARLLANICGGQSWRLDGQWIEWVVDAPDDGLHEIRFKARQNMRSGLASNRRLYVDGIVPCDEAWSITFAYSNNWEITTLKTADSEPVLIPLKKGRHTIRLEVVPGPYSDSIVALRAIVEKLNGIYSNVIMVTSASPDMNRDYELAKGIPGLVSSLEEVSEDLYAQIERFLSLGQEGGELSAVETLLAQAQSFAKNPSEIPSRIGSFKAGIDELAAWIPTLGEQPLDLDYLTLSVPGSKLPKANASFLENFIYGLKAVWASFAPKEAVGDDGLRVWISMGGVVPMGRDQLEIVQELCNSVFTPATGIKVSASLVQQGINEAILAGSGPDAVIYSASSEIAALAMRGAIAEVGDLPGFAELKEELHEQAIVPCIYQGRAYGIPLTQMFSVMFCRKDILQKLGIEPPETWDDLRQALPSLQRNNMQAGVPSADFTFATILFQNGGEYYNSSRTATAFATDAAMEAFSDYTRLFSDYGLPMAYDFFNRFRSGEMPIAIADYVECNRLNVAAPEISGLWEIAEIPGTIDGTGAINRSQAASAGQSGFILSASTKKNAAWEFLKWFSGSEAQAAFGRANEALLGASGRYSPANKAAFDYLPWLSEESELLASAWDNVIEHPQLPGSYYVQRNLASAFRHVVLYADNPREALELYSGEIDRELERKRLEYAR